MEKNTSFGPFHYDIFFQFRNLDKISRKKILANFRKDLFDEILAIEFSRKNIIKNKQRI